MAKRTCDVVVIGGGPGGYVCSIRLGQLKQKVICVEKEEVGGVCLNWGCVPSKALIAASHTYEKVKDHGAGMGIIAKGLEVDSNKMQDWKDGIVKKLTGGVRGLFKGNGVELVMGNARVTGPRTVEVKNAEGAIETHRGDEGDRHRDRLVDDRDPDVQVRRQADHRRARGGQPARRCRSACSSSAAASSGSSSAWSTRSSARSSPSSRRRPRCSPASIRSAPRSSRRSS